MILYIFLSILVVSLLSLIGIFTISLKQKLLKKLLLPLVSFSAGALLGGAFIHLLPQISEKVGFGIEVSVAVLAGILIFFAMEKLISWHHCHEAGTCEDHVKSFGYMNLVGDAVHNLVDGMLIAGAYLVSLPLGIATTLAVILHEIPQEIGDFAVLIYSGFTTKKALLFNFLSALTAFIGAAAVILLSTSFENFAIMLIPFTAGGFIYIAGSDLIPELHKHIGLRMAFLQLLMLVLGMGVMALLLLLE